MKRIFLTFAAMLLLSMGVFAQSTGDVNNDGKVDVADIVKIIDIIKNNGGGSGSVEKVYYWYVSQVDPRTVAEADAVITTNELGQGWRLIADPATYLFDGTTSDKAIWSNPLREAPWYIALPADKAVSMYDVVNAEIDWEHDFTITFKGITYNVWEFLPSFSFGGWKITKL